ncbi:MAG: choice-of-anchor Q domain-containing protein [Planctomycetota bacterium]
MLATLIVDRFDDAVDLDPGDGTCEVAGGGCTLRAAIQESNALTDATTTDVIELPAGTYLLTLEGTDEGQSVSGDLDITDDLFIRGAGADETVVDANAIDRVLDVVRGDVEIRDVTIRGGTIVDDEAIIDGSGGGIRNESNLTLIDTVITGNVATAGAGVANYLGTLRLLRSTVSGNGDVNTLRGGGVSNESNYDSASVEVTDSTITGNRADSGGGIHNYSYDGSANTTIVRSTVSGNSADFGGGVANESVYAYEPVVRATLIMRNSTISGNTASVSGGGTFNQATAYSEASFQINNSTIASNSATVNGGGVFQVDSDGASTTLTSTLVAGNQADAGVDVFSDAASATFTFVQDPDGHSIVDSQQNNIVGLNPLLGPLQDNGGLTQTHLPESISPVIDTGSNLDSLDSDQRGNAFRRTVDLPLNGNASDGTDIGAVETGQEPAPDDFGDAPEGVTIGSTVRNYPTSLAQDGARHRVVAEGPFLGLNPADTEFDALTSSLADGDDLGTFDDEDGIIDGIVLTPGSDLSDLTVQYDGGANGARLQGWIDFNLDGDWGDPGEQILSDFVVEAGPGSMSLGNISVPSDAVSGRSYLRLRISTVGALSPTGFAEDGEVEDYVAIIGAPPPSVADLSLTQTVDQPNPTLAEQITFTIFVRNDGSDRATGVEVGTFLPPELIFISASTSQGNYDDLGEVWEVGSLNNGSTATLQLLVEVDTTDSVTHTAEVIAADQPDPDSTPDNGIEAEDDQETVSLGTCLTRTSSPGVINGLEFSCGSRAGAAIAFARGTTRGQTRFDQYDVTVDMEDATVFALAIADANGVARVPFLLDEENVGETFLMQAFEIGPERLKSNTLVVDVDSSDLPVTQTNFANPADVNNDGRVTALDALIVINRLGALNSVSSLSLESESLAGFHEAGFPFAEGEWLPADSDESRVYPDTNGDGLITALDALFVINRLKLQ